MGALGSLFSCARGRILSALEEISELEGCEFPYRHSRDALLEIKQIFEVYQERLEQLNTLGEKAAPDLALTCSLSLRELFRCLPLLGFILRSTAVRNAFEVFRPFLDILRKAIEPKIGKDESQKRKLVLSSEWTYSPLIYHEIPVLPGYAFIGLPSSESDNPLLIPLSGHELGHSVWTTYKMNLEFAPEFVKAIKDYIRNNWEEYRSHFPDVKKVELDTVLAVQQTWQQAQSWLFAQAKETFCDFIGLRIFGTSFLHAYAYLFAPNVSSPRSVKYPNPIKRVQNLIAAAKDYKFKVPDDYEDMFRDRPLPELTKGEKFQLSIADHILDSKVKILIKRAEELMSKTDIPKPCETKSDMICKRFKFVVPAQKAKSLADIINGAWKAYNNSELWKQLPKINEKKEDVLKDLVLKNIEIFTYEGLLENI
jgi:hypothetical protein